MKNIHKIKENIYITNDEEIKKGDWVLFMFDEVTEIVKVTTIINNAFDSKEGFGYGLEYCKKILLTTDQDLIVEGIQAIPIEEVPTKLDSVLAIINHQNDLGLSKWYEVVYYANGKWCSYSGSKTFEGGERVIEWKYCKELI